MQTHDRPPADSQTRVEGGTTRKVAQRKSCQRPRLQGLEGLQDPR